MKISVTEQDIKNGVRKSWSSCAIALAVKRQTGSECVAVRHDYIYVDGRCVDFPYSIRDFIRRFDRGEFPYPFEFELEGK